jgi:demethylmenaquinone methyltransferase / 2-methoxy-6-polyprenyl-1,4-benzoquinol methylase
VGQALGEATGSAQSLFAPLGPTYDRYARVLSFGQDPRWRSFLVSLVEAAPDQTVLDVASGTGAVAIELARRYRCSVVGIDQSTEMLAAGRRRVATAGVGALVRLEQGRAESLPFEDESFDAVTFTYLLRYVDDPAATLRELARVLRPGGRLASLEFFVPPHPVARTAWELYVRAGLPLAGSIVSPAWGRVGRFLGPSIRGFYERVPLPMLLGLWRAAGIGEPRFRPLSLGGGIVVWGDRER